MRHGAGGDRVEDVLPAAADPAAEPVLDVPGERVRADAVEQAVADPVRVDDARVERVVDPVRRRDQLQVRPGALEGARQLGEARRRSAFASPYSSSVRGSSAPQ